MIAQIHPMMHPGAIRVQSLMNIHVVLCIQFASKFIFNSAQKCQAVVDNVLCIFREFECGQRCPES